MKILAKRGGGEPQIARREERKKLKRGRSTLLLRLNKKTLTPRRAAIRHIKKGKDMCRRRVHASESRKKGDRISDLWLAAGQKKAPWFREKKKGGEGDFGRAGGDRLQRPPGLLTLRSRSLKRRRTGAYRR